MSEAALKLYEAYYTYGEALCGVCDEVINLEPAADIEEACDILLDHWNTEHPEHPERDGDE